MQANHISSLDDNLLIVKVEETDRGEIDFASRDFSPEGASDTDVSMQGDQSGSLDDDMLIVKVDRNDIAEEEDNGEADFASDNIFVEGAVETGLGKLSWGREIMDTILLFFHVPTYICIICIIDESTARSGKVHYVNIV